MFLKYVKYYLFEHKLFGCNHFPGDLTVLSKDTLLKTTDDGMFECWDCTCKCKCGEVVRYGFLNTTDKFWKRR